MLTRARGKVLSIESARQDALEISVDIDGVIAKAIAYTNLTGIIVVGDELLLNTTAIKKSLGTGGFHFVIANLSNADSETDNKEIGHIMKARYTPCQHSVLSVEEDDSPYKKNIDNFKSLDSIPIVIGQLHSQLAPAAAAIKRLIKRKCKIAYIMTDSAALPVSFSRLVNTLKDHHLIDSVITCGQAFGGDIEAVNIYTALIAAKQVVNADAVIVCPGPGNVGTCTEYGFSSIEQGEIINAANILGGYAIAIARISYADKRVRHQGLSHHTLTALSKIALTKATLVLPMMDQMKLMVVQEQIIHSAINYKHKVKILDGKAGIIELQEKKIKMSSMGRTYNEDEEFFLSASAAGAYAAELIIKASSAVDR